jgi:adenine/guanine phosphoribosyltransferase-like PRPP-binding protein
MSNPPTIPDEARRKRIDRGAKYRRRARRSTYTLLHGDHADVYYDIAEVLMGRCEGDEFYMAASKAEIDGLRAQHVPEIKQIIADRGITRLAFIEPDGAAAVGVLPALLLIAEACDVPVCIVRPHKRLLAARVKGMPLERGERVLLIHDVVTTGSSLVQAALCVNDCGARAADAFVVYDRSQGTAAEALKKHGITLHCFGEDWQPGDDFEATCALMH